MRAFIRRLFRDSRDDLIQSQREEIEYLRAQVQKKDKENLALTHTHAYRLVHPEAISGPRDPDAPPVPDVFSMRYDEAPTPEFSQAEMEERVQRAMEAPAPE